MIIVCTAFWVHGWVSGMIQMVVSFVPFGLKSHGGGCQITGLSGDWIRNKRIPDLYISLSVVLIVCFSSWFLSTPFSCSLWWLYSPERQHSSLNASITQTSRYNSRLFPSLLGAKSLIRLKEQQTSVLICVIFLPLQELYQKLTDYDIRFYMYELLKVRHLSFSKHRSFVLDAYIILLYRNKIISQKPKTTSVSIVSPLVSWPVLMVFWHGPWASVHPADFKSGLCAGQSVTVTLVF